MPLNPFFLHGSSTEQNLLQDLINEQLKMYGVDIIYLPRKIINSDNIFKEIESSKFDDNFIIEAYINTYEGYSGAGDLMTKFGVSLRDEVTLTISKERFEEFIAPILTSIYNPNLIYNDPNEIELVSRPREGDLIYFPLGQRLFEIKFVEHEKPFYQLGKTYVYELQCELFEYEDEIIGTTVDEIDDLIKDVTSTLYLMGYDDAQSASIKVFSLSPQSGYVQKIILNQDGNGYTTPPTVYIEQSPVGLSSANATAVAITTSVGDAYSIKEVLITNSGFGYTTPPIVSFIGGGAGAAATTLINTSGLIGISSLSVLNPGVGYYTPPSVSISPQPTAIGSTTAVIVATISDSAAGILSFGIRDAGSGYQVEYDDLGRIVSPTITVPYPEAMSNQNIGVGTFQNGEVVVGSESGSKARVQNWDINTKQLLISTVSGSFAVGETITGADSGAKWTVKKYEDFITEDPYAQNDEIENEGIDILDFSQDNPFGNY